MKLRRSMLCAIGAWCSLPLNGLAQHVSPAQLLQPFVGNSPVKKGRVALVIARLADNGLSVPLKVSVASAMTEQDHVRQLLLLSNRNPRPLIVAFEFGAGAGKPNIATRVRLGGSQTVYALAQMSDGSWWQDTAEVEVTESACLDQT